MTRNRINKITGGDFITTLESDVRSTVIFGSAADSRRAQAATIPGEILIKGLLECKISSPLIRTTD